VTDYGSNAIVGGTFTANDFVGIFFSLFECPGDVVVRHFFERENGFATDGGHG